MSKDEFESAVCGICHYPAKAGHDPEVDHSPSVEAKEPETKEAYSSEEIDDFLAGAQFAERAALRFRDVPRNLLSKGDNDQFQEIDDYARKMKDEVLRALKEDPKVLADAFARVAHVDTVTASVFADLVGAADADAAQLFFDRLPEGLPEWSDFLAARVRVQGRAIIAQEAGRQGHPLQEMSMDESFALFPPEVLIAFATDKATADCPIRIRSGEQERNIRPSDWAGNDRARMAHALVERNEFPDALAWLDAEELPVPDVMALRRNFYDAYCRRAPEKIVKNRELFTDYIRETGIPPEALVLLNEVREVEANLRSGLEIPTADEFAVLDTAALGEIFLRNHRHLQRRVEQLGTENMPALGLHATRTPDLVRKIRESQMLRGMQMVTTPDTQSDAGLALVDLYDVVGGNTKYSTEPGNTVLLFEKVDKVGQVLPRDAGGKPETWGEVLTPPRLRTHSPLSIRTTFRDQLHFALTPHESQLFGYVDKVCKDPSAARAQKSMGLSSVAEFEKSFIGEIAMDDTPLYLALQSQDVQDRQSATRARMADMVYVQTVIDKVLTVLEQRVDRERKNSEQIS